MTSARILIVDDEPDMLENCTRVLLRLGHECLKAENGQAALGIFARQRPDLVVTDLKMPEMVCLDRVGGGRSPGGRV
jgi:two-component system KDP operon response regulator KdpE